MEDIAQGQVEVQKLNRRNEELVAYMKPTAEQSEELKRNCVRIAFLSLKMCDLIKGK